MKTNVLKNCAGQETIVHFCMILNLLQQDTKELTKREQMQVSQNGKVHSELQLQERVRKLKYKKFVKFDYIK